MIIIIIIIIIIISILPIVSIIIINTIINTIIIIMTAMLRALSGSSPRSFAREAPTWLRRRPVQPARLHSASECTVGRLSPNGYQHLALIPFT